MNMRVKQVNNGNIFIKFIPSEVFILKMCMGSGGGESVSAVGFQFKFIKVRRNTVLWEMNLVYVYIEYIHSNLNNYINEW